VSAPRFIRSIAGLSALFVGFVATAAKSDFSGSRNIGYDSSSVLCRPPVFLRSPNPRSPGAPTTSFHTCERLRSRRVGRTPPMMRPSMLPSVIMTTSAFGLLKLLPLYGWPASLLPLCGRCRHHGRHSDGVPEQHRPCARCCCVLVIGGKCSVAAVLRPREAGGLMLRHEATACDGSVRDTRRHSVRDDLPRALVDPAVLEAGHPMR
jgi:hypothetical protein